MSENIVEARIVVRRMYRGEMLTEEYKLTNTMISLPVGMFGFMYVNDDGKLQGLIVPASAVIEVRVYPVEQE